MAAGVVQNYVLVKKVKDEIIQRMVSSYTSFFPFQDGSRASPTAFLNKIASETQRQKPKITVIHDG